MKTIIIIVLLFVLFRKHKADGAKAAIKTFAGIIRGCAKGLACLLGVFAGVNKTLANIVMETKVALNPEQADEIRLGWKAWCDIRKNGGMAGVELTTEENNALIKHYDTWGCSDGTIDGYTLGAVMVFWPMAGLVITLVCCA